MSPAKVFTANNISFMVNSFKNLPMPTETFVLNYGRRMHHVAYEVVDGDHASGKKNIDYVDRAGDALRHGNFAGCGPNGGVLCLAGDDPSCKSSTLPSATEHVLADAMLPVIYPGNVQEVLDLGRLGFMLSRYSGLWVGMKVVTDVADEASTAEVAPERVVPVFPSFEVDGRSFHPRLDVNLLPPNSVELERQMICHKLEAARLYARANNLNRIVVAPPSARIGLIAAGKTYYDLRQALHLIGLDDHELLRSGIRVLKIGLLFPLESQIIREFARGLEEVIVVEEKRPYLETAIRDALYGDDRRPRVVGKTDEAGRPLLPLHGELTVDLILPMLAARLSRHAGLQDVAERVPHLRGSDNQRTLSIVREPYFCSGCPHSRSTLVPEGAIAAGGIGCHAMATWMDRSTVGLTQMGGEGAQWIGIAPFTNTPHIFQNLGDGTLAHSASLAINAAIAAGINLTFKILYNSAVAMTGGQDAAGLLSVPDLTRSLEAAGARKIIITTEDMARYRGMRLAAIAEVWPRDRLDEAQRVLQQAKGVTILIHDQRCAAESRRLRKRGKLPEPATHVFINEAVCEGCGDCGKKANCLSLYPVETEFGRKTQVHQSSCNKDYSCLLGDCPSFITFETAHGSERRRPMRVLDEDSIAEPKRRCSAQNGYSIFMAGIGGTGVVTINQILGMAASFEGKHVRSLDQTGLAQKGGPVVSNLRIFERGEVSTNRLSTGEADLFLGFDLLVAAEPKNLSRAHRQRTASVVNVGIPPTGTMIRNPEIRLPGVDDLTQRLASVTREGELTILDASAMAEGLLGNHMLTNMIILGAAYQLGLIPLTAESIQGAIRLNGAAVQENLAAFGCGRRFVSDPEVIEAAVERPDSDTSLIVDSATGERIAEAVERSRSRFDDSVRVLVEHRARELVAYQDFAYAEQYIDFVKQACAAEQERVPGRNELSTAVARYFYKLLAYKDEYEVARLHVQHGSQDELQRAFPGARHIRWHLQPPLLRAVGVRRKLRFGAWVVPMFRLLRTMRRLRGTALDPFGYAKLRRIERKLIDDYREIITSLLPQLHVDNYEIAVRIAEAPDMVRGYEDVKLRNIERYRELIGGLRVRFREGPGCGDRRFVILGKSRDSMRAAG